MPVGTAVLSFGTAPGGSQSAIVTVTGQTGLAAATTFAEAFLMGSTTAEHNDIEHAMVPMKLTCLNLVDNTGFDIMGVADWVLTGTFLVHWVWT